MEKIHSEVYCMEVRKKISVVITLVLLIVLTTACGKNYSDYPNVWVSEDQSVCIEPGGIAHLNYEEIDIKKNINVLSDSGKHYLKFCYGDKKSCDDSECIWEAEADIRNDKMYLEIVVDNVTNLKGKNIVLEQEK